MYRSQLAKIQTIIPETMHTPKIVHGGLGVSEKRIETHSWLTPQQKKKVKRFLKDHWNTIAMGFVYIILIGLIVKFGFYLVETSPRLERIERQRAIQKRSADLAHASKT